MIIKELPENDSPFDGHFQEEKGAGQEDYDWNDPNLQAIDWSKVEIEGEPYDGPRGDPSIYSDIVDVSKLRHSKTEADESQTVGDE